MSGILLFVEHHIFVEHHTLHVTRDVNSAPGAQAPTALTLDLPLEFRERYEIRGRLGRGGTGIDAE